MSSSSETCGSLKVVGQSQENSSHLEMQSQKQQPLQRAKAQIKKQSAVLVTLTPNSREEETPLRFEGSPPSTKQQFSYENVRNSNVINRSPSLGRTPLLKLSLQPDLPSPQTPRTITTPASPTEEFPQENLPLFYTNLASQQQPQPQQPLSHHLSLGNMHSDGDINRRRKSHNPNEVGQLIGGQHSASSSVGHLGEPLGVSRHQRKSFAYPSASRLNPNAAMTLTPRRSVIGRIERQASFQTQRLSEVGIAVGQQITAKMGLKLPASQERIVEQTRWLYLRYVLTKLRQKALPLRDLNLSKSLQARRAAALGQTIASNRATCTQSAPASAQANSEFASGAPDFSIGEPQFKTRSKRDSLKPDELHLFATDTKLRLGSCKLNSSSSNNNNLDYERDYNHNHGQQSDSSNLEKRTSTYGLVNNTRSSSSSMMFDSSQRERGQQANSMSFNGESVPSNALNASTTNRKFIMDPTINNQIFSVILSIISELHDAKPELYDDTIYELIGIDKFSTLEDLLEVQMTICQEMTRSEITWSRIAALFSLFGAMSLDSVRLGAPENVGPLLDGFVGFVERDLALWISQQGGWESFLYTYRAGNHLVATLSKAIFIALPFVVWALVSLIK